MAVRATIRTNGDSFSKKGKMKTRNGSRERDSTHTFRRIRYLSTRITIPYVNVRRKIVEKERCVCVDTLACACVMRIRGCFQDDTHTHTHSPHFLRSQRYTLAMQCGSTGNFIAKKPNLKFSFYVQI